MKHFDLVLMDMQMPVMDGYTAARRLRERGFTVPIVALTGNAMKGDEEKCIEAGCSSFLSKPVNLDKLMDLVIQELGEADGTEAATIQSYAECASAKTTTAPSVAPRSGISQAATVNGMEPPQKASRRPPLVSELWSDDPEFQEIVVGFTAKLRSQLPLMETAWREQNWKELAQMAHWLKGSAGTLGFDPIVEPAMQLEQSVKLGRSEEAEQALREVIARSRLDRPARLSVRRESL